MSEALTWSGADLVYSMSNKRIPWHPVEAGIEPCPANSIVAENFITCNSYALTIAFLRQTSIRFDEWMRYLDDWNFLLSLYDAGARFYFLPETVSEFRITNDGNIIESDIRRNTPPLLLGYEKNHRKSWRRMRLDWPDSGIVFSILNGPRWRRGSTVSVLLTRRMVLG